MSLRFSYPREEGGQALLEFALLILFIAIVVVGIVSVFGRTLHTTYCRVTHQFAPEADISSTCTIPIVMPLMLARDTNQITLEADIYDPDGDQSDPYGQITRVEFYIDGTEGSPVTVEGIHRYCLGTGDSVCSSYDISGLAAGNHSVIILAYDADGHVGRSSRGFRR